MITGDYSKEITQGTGIWWFIKPNHDWNKLKIGYLKVPLQSQPRHAPNYFAKLTAIKISKATAMKNGLINTDKTFD